MHSARELAAQETAPRSRPESKQSNVPSATLRFLPGWHEVHEGQIRPGGRLLIEYDPRRLTVCRLQWREAQVWNIDVSIVFHPGGQSSTGSVLEPIRQPPNSGPIVDLRPKAYEVTIPSDATMVAMWFRNSYRMSSSCEGWDSRYGQNYRYAVTLGDSEGDSIF